MEIEEASAKVREGPGDDDAEDLALPYWAGRLPVELDAGEAMPSDDLASDIPVPDHIRQWTR